MRDSGLGDALQSAIERVSGAQGAELRELHELRDFYRRHRAAIERAVEGLRALAETPAAERLADALRRDPAQVDAEAARGLLRGPALEPAVGSAQAEGLAGVGVGIALGLDLVIGGAAGAEVVVKLDDNSVLLRGYGVLAAGLDVFAGIGLTLGLYQTLPAVDTQNYTGGLLVDLPLGPGALRVMAVREGSGLWTDPSDFKLLGFIIGFYLGVGGGVMLYRGPQLTLALPSRRAMLTVCNCTDGTDPCQPGTSSIAQNVASVLDFTLENTSGKTITIAVGDEMTVDLPRYFTSDDASKIAVAPPKDWTSEGWNGTTLTMAYAGSSALAWDTGSIQFTLTNARPSQPDPLEGRVRVEIPDAVVDGSVLDKDGFVASATLTLVPWIKYATISVWSAGFPDFTLVDGQPTGGTDLTVPSLEDENAVAALTVVTDANGNDWELGYQFYLDPTTEAPYFRACWYEQGTFVKYDKTLFAPNFMVLSSSAQQSTAYYQNIQGNPNTIQITVTLNP